MFDFAILGQIFFFQHCSHSLSSFSYICTLYHCGLLFCPEDGGGRFLFWTTESHMLEDSNAHRHCCEGLRSHIIYCVLHCWTLKLDMYINVTFQLSRPTSRLMHLLILDAFQVSRTFLLYIQNIVNYNTVIFKYNSVHINLKTV